MRPSEPPRNMSATTASHQEEHSWVYTVFVITVCIHTIQARWTQQTCTLACHGRWDTFLGETYKCGVGTRQADTSVPVWKKTEANEPAISPLSQYHTDAQGHGFCIVTLSLLPTVLHSFNKYLFNHYVRGIIQFVHSLLKQTRRKCCTCFLSLFSLHFDYNLN